MARFPAPYGLVRFTHPRAKRFALGPGDFQFIGNFGHTLDMAEGLLGHLLLEVGVDYAAEGNSTLLGLKS